MNNRIESFKIMDDSELKQSILSLVDKIQQAIEAADYEINFDQNTTQIEKLKDNINVIRQFLAPSEAKDKEEVLALLQLLLDEISTALPIELYNKLVIIVEEAEYDCELESTGVQFFKSLLKGGAEKFKLLLDKFDFYIPEWNPHSPLPGSSYTISNMPSESVSPSFSSMPFSIQCWKATGDDQTSLTHLTTNPDKFQLSLNNKKTRSDGNQIKQNACRLTALMIVNSYEEAKGNIIIESNTKPAGDSDKENMKEIYHAIVALDPSLKTKVQFKFDASINNAVDFYTEKHVNKHKSAFSDMSPSTISEDDFIGDEELRGTPHIY